MISGGHSRVMGPSRALAKPLLHVHVDVHKLLGVSQMGVVGKAPFSRLATLDCHPSIVH